MTRDVTAAAEAALQAANVPMLVLVAMYFDTGTVYVTNGAYTVTWNGLTFLGLGRFMGLEALEESGALQAVGLGMTFSGIPPDMLSIALQEDYQGRPAEVWVAPLDDEFRMIADPIGPFTYLMDTMPFRIGATAAIKLNCESRLVDLARPRVRRYNDADQRKEFPTDTGMQFVEQMVEKTLIWGRG